MTPLTSKILPADYLLLVILGPTEQKTQAENTNMLIPTMLS